MNVGHEYLRGSVPFHDISRILILFLTVASANAQYISEDSYCIKLKTPDGNSFYSRTYFDTTAFSGEGISGELERQGRLLSRFGEESIVNSGREIFRSVTFGSSRDLKDVRIVTFERKDTVATVTIRLLNDMWDSTILVHKKTFALRKWTDFSDLALKRFLTQPTFKNGRPIMDGSTTVFEGRLFGRYHYLSRHVMSLNDPGLMEVDMYLSSMVATFFPPDCSEALREK
jgi:hypothetical protein